MKTIEIECRQIDEWDEETRNKIIEKHRDINTEGQWWYSVYDMWKEKLKEMGYIDTEIRFSGFWSQGDGASFTAKYVDILIWLRKQNNPKYSRIVKLLENNINSELDYSTEVTRNTYHYSHERTVSLQLQWYPDKVYDMSNIMSLLNQIEADIDEDIIDQCQAIYRDLEEENEGLTSDEAVAETLRINEYELDKTGKIHS